MAVYVALLAFAVTTALVAGRGEQERSSPGLLPTLAIALACALVVGLRYKTGTDYWIYAEWYRFVLPGEGIKRHSMEIGFTFLCKAVQAVAGTDPSWMFLVVALLTSVPVLLVLRAHARPFALGVAIYLLAGTFFFSFNTMRQALASSIVFAGTPYLLRRDWRRFLTIVLVASLFHSSALLMAPIYFIAGERPCSLPAVVGLVAAAAVMLPAQEYVAAAMAADRATRFGRYAATVALGGHGANVAWVAERAAIFAVAYARREALARLLPRGSGVLVNMALVSTCLWLLASHERLYARLAFYPSLYSMITLPLIVRTFLGRERPFVAVGVFAFFLVYGAGLLLAGIAGLLPYRSVLG
jgi:transmembrane protein EpsG